LLEENYEEDENDDPEEEKVIQEQLEQKLNELEKK